MNQRQLPGDDDALIQQLTAIVRESARPARSSSHALAMLKVRTPRRGLMRWSPALAGVVVIGTASVAAAGAALLNFNGPSVHRHVIATAQTGASTASPKRSGSSASPSPTLAAKGSAGPTPGAAITPSPSGATPIPAPAGCSAGSPSCGVWGWGSNASGQLGNNTTNSALVAQHGAINTTLTTVAAGWDHSLAIRNDGTVWSWGNNTHGDLGYGTCCSGTATPARVNGLTSVVAIATHSTTDIALRSDGTVWTWGAAWVGQLGNNGTADRWSPVEVCAPGSTASPCTSFLTGIIAVSIGWDHTLALSSDGTVFAWGGNEMGQLGTGSACSSGTTCVGSEVPVRVSGLSGIVAIGAGQQNSVALRSDGTVFTWGENYYGELGTNTSCSTNPCIGSTVPVQVKGPGGAGTLTGVASITMGQFHSVYAVMTSGTVWAWGMGGSGQLGDGTRNSAHTPMQVCAPGQVSPCSSFLTGIAAVSGGNQFALALRKSDGTVFAWGLNSDGELGDGTTNGRDSPTAVLHVTGARMIAGGGRFGLALM